LWRHHNGLCVVEEKPVKTKFNPKDVPKWCNWIAVDDDGRCWTYSIKPERGVIEFMWWPQQHGRWGKLYEGKPPKNWKEELYTWK